jgi:predicted RNA binding protein YcfA (HicA-like mRNA interferase family)
LKLKPYSYRVIINVLNKIGFTVVRQKGSHIVLKGFYRDKKRTVVVPRHKEISIGTLRGILFQAGLTIEEFIELAEKG